MASRIVLWPDGSGVARELLLLEGTVQKVVLWPDGSGVARELLYEAPLALGGELFEESLIESVDLEDFVDSEFGDVENLTEDLVASELVVDTMAIESIDLLDDAEASDLMEAVFGDGGLFEQALASETIQSSAIFSESLIDQVLVVIVDVEYEALTEAWVVNLKTNGISRYNWPDFNSFTFVNGKYYAAKDDGIFEIGGEDDAGSDIAAFATTGKMDYDSMQKKRTFAVYLDVETDGQMNLQVYADGQVYTYPFEIPPRNIANQLHETVRASPGRGLRARNWVFEIQNVEGSDFDASRLQILPVIIDRRVR